MEDPIPRSRCCDDLQVLCGDLDTDISCIVDEDDLSTRRTPCEYDTCRRCIVHIGFTRDDNTSCEGLSDDFRCMETIDIRSMIILEPLSLKGNSIVILSVWTEIFEDNSTGRILSIDPTYSCICDIRKTENEDKPIVYRPSWIVDMWIKVARSWDQAEFIGTIDIASSGR